MKAIIQHTWTVLTPKERSRLMMLTLAGVVISIADILSLVALLWIIQFYIQPESPVITFLPGWLAHKESLALVAVFVGLFAAKNYIAWRIARSNHSFNSEVAHRIAVNNLISFQQSSFSSFVHTDSSQAFRKIAVQPFEFAQHVVGGLQQISTQLFLVGLTLIAIIIYNASLFLLLLATLLPPVVLVFYFIRKKMGQLRHHLRDSNERSYQYLMDALKGFAESNIGQRNDFFLQRFARQRKDFGTHVFRSHALQNLPARVIEIFAVLGLFLLLAITQWMGNNDHATLLNIGAFMAAAYKIIPGIVKLINHYGMMKAYEFSSHELAAANIVAPGPGEKTDPLIHKISFENIRFGFDDRPLLHSISFTLKPGDILGISGKSGTGKTTLLNLLLGFLESQSGQILINDQPAGKTILREYWPAIAYVRQQSFFIYDTIQRNITFEENGYDPAKFELALRVSGLDQMICSFPEGLQKIITENGKNISGGQQQRILIARAVYKDAGLLLLDEPFNELDDAATLSILEHLKQLSANKIIILITHDKKCHSYCNKILSLDEQP